MNCLMVANLAFEDWLVDYENECLRLIACVRNDDVLSDDSLRSQKNSVRLYLKPGVAKSIFLFAVFSAIAYNFKAKFYLGI